jgi:hypothetical protein
MVNVGDVTFKYLPRHVSMARGRQIIVLLLGVLLGLLGLWQAGLLPQLAGAGEAIAVQSITLPARDQIVVHVRNSGSEPVTVAQVQVDSAYWAFSLEPGTTIGPATRATLTIPYLWVQDEPHTITIITSSGAAFEARITSASLGSTQSGIAALP